MKYSRSNDATFRDEVSLCDKDFRALFKIDIKITDERSPRQFLVFEGVQCYDKLIKLINLIN
jgi:hypothetical protein